MKEAADKCALAIVDITAGEKPEELFALVLSKVSVNIAAD
jgi:hypothetical protein